MPPASSWQFGAPRVIQMNGSAVVGFAGNATRPFAGEEDAPKPLQYTPPVAPIAYEAENDQALASPAPSARRQRRQWSAPLSPYPTPPPTLPKLPPLPPIPPLIASLEEEMPWPLTPQPIAIPSEPLTDGDKHHSSNRASSSPTAPGTGSVPCSAGAREEGTVNELLEEVLLILPCPESACAHWCSRASRRALACWAGWHAHRTDRRARAEAMSIWNDLSRGWRRMRAASAAPPTPTKASASPPTQPQASAPPRPPPPPPPPPPQLRKRRPSCGQSGPPSTAATPPAAAATAPTKSCARLHPRPTPTPPRKSPLQPVGAARSARLKWPSSPFHTPVAVASACKAMSAARGRARSLALLKRWHASAAAAAAVASAVTAAAARWRQWTRLGAFSRWRDRAAARACDEHAAECSNDRTRRETFSRWRDRSDARARTEHAFVCLAHTTRRSTLRASLMLWDTRRVDGLWAAAALSNAADAAWVSRAVRGFTLMLAAAGRAHTRERCWQHYRIQTISRVWVRVRGAATSARVARCALVMGSRYGRLSTLRRAYAAVRRAASARDAWLAHTQAREQGRRHWRSRTLSEAWLRMRGAATSARSARGALSIAGRAGRLSTLRRGYAALLRAASTHCARFGKLLSMWAEWLSKRHALREWRGAARRDAALASRVDRLRLQRLSRGLIRWAKVWWVRHRLPTTLSRRGALRRCVAHWAVRAREIEHAEAARLVWAAGWRRASACMRAIDSLSIHSRWRRDAAVAAARQSDLGRAARIGRSFRAWLRPRRADEALRLVRARLTSRTRLLAWRRAARFERADELAVACSRRRLARLVWAGWRHYVTLEARYDRLLGKLQSGAPRERHRSKQPRKKPEAAAKSDGDATRPPSPKLKAQPAAGAVGREPRGQWQCMARRPRRDCVLQPILAPRELQRTAATRNTG